MSSDAEIRRLSSVSCTLVGVRGLLALSLIPVSLISVSLLASTAAAQEDDTARARQAFGEGVAASQNQDWETAAARFEEAQSLHPAPTIEYNLASAYLELGRLGEAGDMTAHLLADPATEEDVRTLAQELDQQIAERAGTLTIEVEGEANAGATVTVDGRELAPDRVGVSRYETPGARQVRITRTDASTEEQTVVVDQGSPARVTFGPPLLGGDDEEGGSLFTDPVFWAVAGGAVLLTVIIIIAAATAGPNEVGGDYSPPVLRF